MGIDLFCSGRQLSDSASTYPLWSRLSKCLTLRAFKSVESRVVVVGGCATQSHRFSVCQLRELLRDERLVGRVLGLAPGREGIIICRLRSLGLALFLEITEHMIIIITLLGI